MLQPFETCGFVQHQDKVGDLAIYKLRCSGVFHASGSLIKPEPGAGSWEPAVASQDAGLCELMPADRELWRLLAQAWARRSGGPEVVATKQSTRKNQPAKKENGDQQTWHPPRAIVALRFGRLVSGAQTQVEGGQNRVPAMKSAGMMGQVPTQPPVGAFASRLV